MDLLFEAVESADEFLVDEVRGYLSGRLLLEESDLVGEVTSEVTFSISVRGASEVSIEHAAVLTVAPPGLFPGAAFGQGGPFWGRVRYLGVCGGMRRVTIDEAAAYGRLIRDVERAAFRLIARERRIVSDCVATESTNPEVLEGTAVRWGEAVARIFVAVDLISLFEERLRRFYDGPKDRAVVVERRSRRIQAALSWLPTLPRPVTR